MAININIEDLEIGRWWNIDPFLCRSFGELQLYLAEAQLYLKYLSNKSRTNDVLMASMMDHIKENGVVIRQDKVETTPYLG